MFYKLVRNLSLAGAVLGLFISGSAYAEYTADQIQAAIPAQPLLL